MANDYELVEYAIDRLEEFFQARRHDDEPKTHKKAACIYSFFLRNKFEALKRLGQEIDERIKDDTAIPVLEKDVKLQARFPNREGCFPQCDVRDWEIAATKRELLRMTRI